MKRCGVTYEWNRRGGKFGGLFYLVFENIAVRKFAARFILTSACPLEFAERDV